MKSNIRIKDCVELRGFFLMFRPRGWYVQRYLMAGHPALQASGDVSEICNAILARLQRGSKELWQFERYNRQKMIDEEARLQPPLSLQHARPARGGLRRALRNSDFSFI